MSDSISRRDFIKRLGPLVALGPAALAAGFAPAAEALTPASRKVALGCWCDHAFQNRHEPQRIDAYAELVGAMPKLVMMFESIDRDVYKDHRVQAILDRGATPVISHYVNNIHALNRGEADATIAKYAKALASSGQNIVSRLMWEMNGDWYPYGVARTEVEPAQFVRAWRRVVNIFRHNGARDSIKFFFCPMSPPRVRNVTYESIYPGASFVDWVGFDAYNWGTTQRWTNWRPFVYQAKPGYDALKAIAPHKPMVVGEYSSVESGGNKAGWIHRAHFTDLPSLMPDIKGLMWFHQDRRQIDGGPNWLVDTSPSSLAAYRKVAAAARYQGSM